MCYKWDGSEEVGMIYLLTCIDVGILWIELDDIVIIIIIVFGVSVTMKIINILNFHSIIAIGSYLVLWSVI